MSYGPPGSVGGRGGLNDISKALNGFNDHFFPRVYHLPREDLWIFFLCISSTYGSIGRNDEKIVII